MTHVLAIENEQGEIRLTVLKSCAGGMENITDIFWRATKNDVADRIRPVGRSLGATALWEGLRCFPIDLSG